MVDFFDLNGSSQDPDWSRIVMPAVVSANLPQSARTARNAEVIITNGDDKFNRLASDCWEIDLIGSPEVHSDKDFMHQVNSGIDYVIARSCAEKGIAIEFCFANVLNSHGRRRANILARMAQNVKICRDTDCDMIITSGATEKYGLRAPRDLIAFGTILGMSLNEAQNALSLNPQKVLKRAEDRANPNIILKGLEVKVWASKQKEKRIYGWY
jgi:RNase P/RNase MRP subunit p30